MRTYPQDSPEAAARIVALTMLADGAVSRAEADVIEARGASRRLGLQPQQWQAVLHELCEDLLSAAGLSWHPGCRVDPQTLSELLAEIADPMLRLEVLRLCLAVVEADEHVADSEAFVVGTALEQWGLQHEMLRPANESRLLAAA
jgi:uncharacterized tellurite resistance protein B-like protein